MSDDIVERLRSRANQPAIRFGNMGYYSEADATLDKQAADEIERLRALLAQAEQKVFLQQTYDGTLYVDDTDGHRYTVDRMEW